MSTSPTLKIPLIHLQSLINHPWSSSHLWSYAILVLCGSCPHPPLELTARTQFYLSVSFRIPFQKHRKVILLKSMCIYQFILQKFFFLILVDFCHVQFSFTRRHLRGPTHSMPQGMMPYRRAWLSLWFTMIDMKCSLQINKAEYTATLVACGWAGAVLEKVTRASGQEPYAQKAQKRRKSKKGTNRPTDGPT